MYIREVLTLTENAKKKKRATPKSSKYSESKEMKEKFLDELDSRPRRRYLIQLRKLTNFDISDKIESTLTVSMYMRFGGCIRLEQLKYNHQNYSILEDIKQLVTDYNKLKDSTDRSGKIRTMTSKINICLRELLSDKINSSQHDQLSFEKVLANHNKFLMDKLPDFSLLGLAKNFDYDLFSMDNKFKYICKSYPEMLLTFKYLAEDRTKLKALADFHVHGRMPILSYIWKHKVNQYCTLWRSSQIKSGIGGFMGITSKSEDEVQLVRNIGKLCFNTDNQLAKAQVIDCRHQGTAFKSMISGYGYYDTKTYHIQQVSFASMHDHHAVRESYQSLQSSFEHGSDIVVLMQWFNVLKSAIDAAMQVRDLVLKGDSVIVNCSDGWDRTPIVCSLVKILLDPYYRTIMGFRELVDSEWTAHGHPFKRRQAYPNNEDHSPTFFQFLDCVYQFKRQFPSSFEFTEKLLVILAHSYSEDMFMEFACDNTEQYLEYRQLSADEKDQGELSIWQFIGRQSVIEARYRYRSQYLNVDSGCLLFDVCKMMPMANF